MRHNANYVQLSRIYERNSHCDVLHITPVRVARLVLDDAIAATLIDNIFTNSSRNSFNGILLSDISDHFPIFCINITTCVIRTDAEFKQQREYKTKNIADFSEKNAFN